MERRGEGFERERIPPEPRREVRPLPERNIAPAGSYYEERYGPLEPGMQMRSHDLTRWGPVFAGFFVTLSLIVLLGVLGAAIGLGFTVSPDVAGTGAAIWGAVTLIVAFFVGGWLAGRTASIAGAMVGAIHGVAVWAVTTTVLLVLGAFGLAGVLGAIMGPGAATPADAGLAQGAAVGTFVALTLGLIAAAIGGWLGGQNVYTRPTEQ